MQTAMHPMHHAGHHEPPQIQMEDACQVTLQAETLLADSSGKEPASAAEEKDTLQVKRKASMQTDTAVYSPPGAKEPTLPVKSSHQVLDRCLAEAAAVERSLDKLSAVHTRGTRPKVETLARDDVGTLEPKNPVALLNIVLARAASVHQRLDKLTAKESSRRKPDAPGGQASSRQTSNLEAPTPAKAENHLDLLGGSTGGQPAQPADPPRQHAEKEEPISQPARGDVRHEADARQQAPAP